MPTARIATRPGTQNVVRELTPDEINQREADLAAEQEREAKAQAERDQAAADEQAWRDAIRDASTLDEVKALIAGNGTLPVQAEACRNPNADRS